MYDDFTQYQEESTIHNRRFSTLGYWTPEPEHVRNSPITGKPYLEDEIKEELQELEKSAGRHTQLRRNILKEKYESYTVIDSGADQTTLGRGHVILDQEEFPGTSMGGPSPTMGNMQMHKCTGICLVTSTEGPVIIRYNNAITYDETEIKNNVESLISSNQLRSYGIFIDDTPQSHGGGQCMAIPTQKGHCIIPFQHHGGATILVHRIPTKEEIEKLPVLDVTDSSTKWRPTTLPKHEETAEQEFNVEISERIIQDRKSKGRLMQ